MYGASYADEISKAEQVSAGVVGEIVCVFHNPTSVIGLLPSIDRFGCIDVRIFHVAHGKGMERYLHAAIVADKLLFAYEFLRHGKYLGNDIGAGSGHCHVFSLGTVSSAKLYEVDP